MNRLLTTVSVLGAGGGGAPPGDPGQIVGVTGSYTVGGAGTVATYTSAPLGSPVMGRILYIVCAFFDGSSTDEFPSSVTVGGNAATRLASVYEASANTCGLSIWSYQDNGALGANADIVVTHPIARNSLSLAVLAASAGDGNVVDFVGDAALTGSIAADNLTTAGAKCLIYASMFQNGYDPVSAPAPFTDGSHTYDENTDEWVCIGWANTPSGSPESVTIPTGGSPAPLRAAYLAVALD